MVWVFVSLSKFIYIILNSVLDEFEIILSFFNNVYDTVQLILNQKKTNETLTLTYL